MDSRAGVESGVSRSAQQHRDALASRGRLDEAIAHHRSALELNPSYAEAHNNLGNALTQTGRVDEAIPHFRKAIEVQPDLGVAHTALAVALAITGQPASGIAEAQQALKLSGGNDPMVLNLLGRLYAETGQLAKAIETTRQALKAASESQNTELIRDLNTELTGYLKQTHANGVN